MTFDASSRQAPSVLFGVTVAVTARAFLVGQLGFLRSRGWTVHLVAGEATLEDFAESEGVDVHGARTARNPSPRDAASLLRLWRLIRRIRPSIVVMGTPKMGLLGTTAAYLARVPVRVYLAHGFRGDGVQGLGGRVIRILDRFACRLATNVVSVSPSLRDKLVHERIVDPSKVIVLGNGSANGVDTERFRPAATDAVQQLRVDMGLPPRAKVIAFVGRLTRDKGLRDLAELWRRTTEAHPERWLLVAGAEEPVDALDDQALSELDQLPRVVRVEHTDQVELVYQAADVLLMLSKREGLGMVVLEAAACGVPAVAYQTTGVVDAIVDGETGLLSPLGDLWAVQDRLSAILSDEAALRRLGRAARGHVVARFERDAVWRNWESLLKELASPSGETYKTRVS